MKIGVGVRIRRSEKSSGQVTALRRGEGGGVDIVVLYALLPPCPDEINAI